MSFIDPYDFQRMCWPDMVLASYQREIIDSVVANYETVVPAGNALGKDYIAAFIALWWQCSRRPARTVTTSASGNQLNDVLWGEIRQLINTSRHPLPLQYNHMHIRQVDNQGEFVDKSELIGQTVTKGEALLGRHLPQFLNIPRTLVVLDESSGIKNTVYESCKTWAHCILIIGNPFPCANFFQEKAEAGNVKSITGDGLRTNVIHVRAEDSPNVKAGLQEIREGKRKPEPCLVKSDKYPRGVLSGKEYKRLALSWKLKNKQNPPEPMVVPGLIGINEYIERRTNWDPMMQSISLDGEFYRGKEVLLYPPEWLAMSAEFARTAYNKVGWTMGVDPAEGGDSTAYCICSREGIVELVSVKTPDTSDIPKHTMAYMAKHKLSAKDVYFDAGGGGKQHVDLLRDQYGHHVNAIRFGAAATAKRTRARKTLKQREGEDETKYAFKNKRCEMYWAIRERLDPAMNKPFAIPVTETELRRQLAPLPLQYDESGRMWLPPKRAKNPDSAEITLEKMLGCSPDESDAFALAMYGQVAKTLRGRVGAF